MVENKNIQVKGEQGRENMTMIRLVQHCEHETLALLWTFNYRKEPFSNISYSWVHVIDTIHVSFTNWDIVHYVQVIKSG